VGHYPANKLIGREPLPMRPKALFSQRCLQKSVCGITRPLGRLSPTPG
jgi:hypothetical protein